MHDIQYLELLDRVMRAGVHKDDRTGTGTTSVFAQQMRFDLSDNTVPLLTTKRMHLPSIIHELLWYISGSSNIKYLQDNGVRIWNEWADENGDLGPVYGQQWRRCPDFTKATFNHDTLQFEYPTIDQLQNVISTLRTNPDCRRMIVDSWNVAQIPLMKLPPCHFCFQFYTSPIPADEWLALDNLHPLGDAPTRRLHCKLTQRSCDLFLGVPFNISQYSILTRMIASITGMLPGEFIWEGGDVHIYDNHRDQVNLQLHRIPFDSPVLDLNTNIRGIDSFSYGDFTIRNYISHEPIKATVAI